VSRSAQARLLWLFVLLSFCTAGAATDVRAAESFAFGVIGDSGTGRPEQYAVGETMDSVWQKTPFSLVLMLGDNLYGEFKGAESFKERFELPYARLLKRGVKFRAVLGNHGEAAGELGYAPFGMEGKRYYTFMEGGGLAQFFALDSDQLDATPVDAAQVAWLESELKASTARWKIAYFHQPIYNAGRTHGPNLKLRAVVESLFIRYGVGLVLSGHEHVYERLKPRHGIAYFVSGSSGKVKVATINGADDSLAFGNDTVCHFMIFEVTPEQIKFRAISATGQIIDSGTLAAPAPGAAR
jgi:hypothetical protein